MGENFCKLYLLRDSYLRVQRAFLQFNNKDKNSVKKWAKKLNRHFSEEAI